MSDRLPQEICDYIADNLDIDTILSLRCTCKYFLKMMSSQYIWSNLAHQLQSNPRVMKPEGCVKDSPELRGWVIRRHRAQELLRTDSHASFKKRGILRSGVGQVELLPGGRWLLFIRGSNMFFVDCDTAGLEPQLLVSSDAPTRNGLVRFTTWIDLDSPHLSFRVAVIHWEKMRVDLSSRQFWVMFYDVNQVGRDSTAMLVSKPQGPGKQCSGTITRDTHFEGLNNDYFIQLILASDLPEDEDVLSVQVVKYLKPSSSLDFHEVSLQGIRGPALDFYMLPGNRFAASGIRDTFIYSIPDAETEEPVNPIDRLAISLPTPRVSTYFRSSLFVDDISTRIVYRLPHQHWANMNSIIARIPHDVHEHSTIERFPEVDRILRKGKQLLFIGLWSTVFISQNGTGSQSVLVVDHSWLGLGERENVVKQFSISEVHGDRIRAFDEGIGRMVIQDHTFGDTTIFDVVQCV